MAGEAVVRRGLWTRVMAFLGLEEDEEGREEAPEAGGEARRLVTLPGGRAQRAPAPAEVRPTALALYQPRVFDEARGALDRLRRRCPVVVQLNRADRESAQRILDFLSGGVYALEGSLYVLGPGVYLAAPGGVQVSDLRGEEP